MCVFGVEYITDNDQNRLSSTDLQLSCSNVILQPEDEDGLLGDLGEFDLKSSFLISLDCQSGNGLLGAEHLLKVQDTSSSGFSWP